MKVSKRIMIECADNPGLFIRAALILERRGYDLNDYRMERNNNLSRIYMSVDGDLGKFDQIKKQLARLIDVAFVSEID